MVSAVAHEGLLISAIHLVEVPFEGSWLFNSIIVLESLIQQGDHLLEAIFFLGDSVNEMFHLLPSDAGEGGDHVDASLLWSLLERHLLLVEVNPGSPFSVVLWPIAEDRHIGIFECLHGGC